jgi:hypothetical protein
MITRTEGMAICTRKMLSDLASVLLAAILVVAHAAIAQADPNGPPGSPAIVLPDGLSTAGQRADAPIDIRFVTAPDAAVDLTSLHVWVRKLPGWIEVTDSLLRHPQVHVNESGIHFDAGVLPVGDHEVRLSFHDMKGRILDATGTIRLLRPS